MQASGVRDVRDGLPLWSMNESECLQHLERDDGDETSEHIEGEDDGEV